MKSNDSCRRKILVVDDLAELRDLICDVVQDLGYTALSAEDGQAGLRLLYSESPLAVICDIKMHVMNGLEFLKVIRSKGNEVPFIY